MAKGEWKEKKGIICLCLQAEGNPLIFSRRIHNRFKMNFDNLDNSSIYQVAGQSPFLPNLSLLTGVTAFLFTYCENLGHKAFCPVSHKGLKTH